MFKEFKSFDQHMPPTADRLGEWKRKLFEEWIDVEYHCTYFIPGVEGCVPPTYRTIFEVGTRGSR
jgi:hypothetical protein